MELYEGRILYKWAFNAGQLDRVPVGLPHEPVHGPEQRGNGEDGRDVRRAGLLDPFSLQLHARCEGGSLASWMFLGSCMPLALAALVLSSSIANTSRLTGGPVTRHDLVLNPHRVRSEEEIRVMKLLGIRRSSGKVTNTGTARGEYQCYVMDQCDSHSPFGGCFAVFCWGRQGFMGSLPAWSASTWCGSQSPSASAASCTFVSSLPWQLRGPSRTFFLASKCIFARRQRGNRLPF